MPMGIKEAPTTRKYIYPPAQQADAAISQANPVSTQLYTVLDTTANCRILSINAAITWATTQPTPLEVVITIDGQSIVHSQANPVSATPYIALQVEGYTAANQTFSTSSQSRAFLYEGRSVKVEVRVTWAVTQPTPLTCRVKYATW